MALILRIAAPNIGLEPLAECIIRSTGMRSEAVSRSLERRLGPERQLWQPVSAIAVVARLCVSMRKGRLGTPHGSPMPPSGNGMAGGPTREPRPRLQVNIISADLQTRPPDCCGGNLDSLPVEGDAGGSGAEGGGKSGVVFLSGGCYGDARED